MENSVVSPDFLTACLQLSQIIRKLNKCIERIARVEKWLHRITVSRHALDFEGELL